MFLLVQAEREASVRGRGVQEACIGWTLDGQAIAIRDKEELVSRLLPIAFCQKAKFTSFTRKLYRWGFRQLADKEYKIKPKTAATVFWHPSFQRDNKPLVLNMKSTTAERTMNAMKKSNMTADKEAASPELLAEKVTLPIKGQSMVKSAQRPENVSSLCTLSQRSEVSVDAIQTQRLRLEQLLAEPTMFSPNALEGGHTFASQNVRSFMSSADLVTAALLRMSTLTERRMFATPVASDPYVFAYGCALQPSFDMLSSDQLLQLLRVKVQGLHNADAIQTALRVSGGALSTEVLLSLLRK